MLWGDHLTCPTLKEYTLWSEHSHMLGVILVCAEAALDLNHFENNIDVKFWSENCHVSRNGIFYDYYSSILKCSLDVIYKLCSGFWPFVSLTLVKKIFNRIITRTIDRRVYIMYTTKNNIKWKIAYYQYWTDEAPTSSSSFIFLFFYQGSY